MRETCGWSDRDSYARFLGLQYAARLPVEAWLDANAPPQFAPPAQAPLIARDLGQLEADIPPVTAPFELAAGDEAATLGVVWVLAGSSLGNRAILNEIPKEWPGAFLADAEMLAFWRSLRSAIERPATEREVRSASQSAIAVFDHFLALAKRHEIVREATA